MFVNLHSKIPSRNGPWHFSNGSFNFAKGELVRPLSKTCAKPLAILGNEPTKKENCHSSRWIGNWESSIFLWKLEALVIVTLILMLSGFPLSREWHAILILHFITLRPLRVFFSAPLREKYHEISLPAFARMTCYFNFTFYNFAPCACVFLCVSAWNISWNFSSHSPSSILFSWRLET